MKSQENERFQVKCAYDASTGEYVYTIEMPAEDQKILEQVFYQHGLTVEEAVKEFLLWTASHPDEFRAWYEKERSL